MFEFSSVRRDENIIFWHFVFCVWCIYDELMFDLLNATCTVKMRLTPRLSLVFPRTFWTFISHFPSFFPFIRFLSLFSWHSRVFLFFKLSFLVLHYLVSSSCSSLLSCSYMVDYSFVSLILLHFGLQLFADVLSFGIPLSFAALHSGKSALPH